MNAKRIFNLGMVVIMLITSFAVSQPVAAEAPVKFTPRIAPGAQNVPGEVVVAFANSQDKTLVEKIEQAVETANDTGGEVTRLSLDGSAVIQVNGDTAAVLAELNGQPDVLYAEPNYVYSAPEAESSSEENTLNSDYVFRSVAPSASTNWKSIMAVPNSTIQSMVAMGTYPTDSYLTANPGWFNVGADIVWTNGTASANVCQIDTGVDYSHPDLWYTYSRRVRVRVKKGKKYIYVYKTYTYTAYRTIPGYDFVNADSDPMDDNGHGTHVAGIMVAMQNNNAGVMGISTGNVVAMKALDAQGVGTNFDVAKAIQQCADRTDVRVINLSLGGPAQSATIHDALLYATTPTTQTVASGSFMGLPGKGKLVVVASGNDNSQTPTYPAGYADHTLYPEFPVNSILSVGATGKLVSGDMDYSCKSATSNYGSWVNVAAPGEEIYSTTPYDKPFYQNYYGHLTPRYDYLSGTSMAAAFVSASAARRMGYKPLETSTDVGTAIVAPLDPNNESLIMNSTCTPNEMLAVKRVNVAYLMDRAGIRVSVFDAAAGTPLNGASVAAAFLNDGVNTAYRYATISPETTKTDPWGLELDPNRIFTYYVSVTDILDVPTVNTLGNAISNYSVLVSKAGYTAGYQPAFQQDKIASLTPGTFNVITNGAVPPLSADFNVVMGWHEWNQYAQEATSYDDLDLYIWLPGPSFVDANQPAKFIAGFAGDANGEVEDDSYGSLNAFPFTRLKREGGFLDGGPTVETTTILKRAAHGAVLANAALPYYAGSYTVFATDYGQTIDHDGDGCGDNYGFDYDSGYTPGAECTGKTAGIPLLGAYFTPYAYVWKDGVVKQFLDGSNNFGPFPANDACNKHWWKAFAITSPLSGTVPTYTNFDSCNNGEQNGFFPYPAAPNSGSRVETFIFGK